MTSKVKPEKLKLGDILYFVERYNLTRGVQKATITTLSLNDKKEVTFKTDNRIDTYSLNGWYMYVSRSELKAKRVYDELAETRYRQRVKQQVKREIYEENRKNIDKVSKNYVGKTVMVRFKDHSKEKSYYKKVTINTLYPTYNKDEYLFDTKPRTNDYLTTREGKNWYFWSELDELKQQKETIEKRIKELENEKDM